MALSRITVPVFQGLVFESKCSRMDFLYFKINISSLGDERVGLIGTVQILMSGFSIVN